MFTTRSVHSLIWGQRKALAVAGQRRILNLTGNEVLSKLKQVLWPQRTNFEKRTSWDYKIMSWASGQGTTTELYVYPEGSSLKNNSAIWRISMATVSEDGPFSLLPGYQRIIAIAEGNGFRLKGRNEGEVKWGIIHNFSGEEQVDCSLLAGPCLDFNVIYKSNIVKAGLELFSLQELKEKASLSAGKNETIIIVCLAGKGQVTAGNVKETLQLYESIRVSCQDNIEWLITIKTLLSSSKFALVRISKRENL